MTWDLPPGSDLWLIAHLIVYCRIQTCLIAMPALGEKLLPARIRIALAMVLTPLFAPAAQDLAMPRDIFALAFLAGGELVTGLILGVLVRILALALDIASSTIATTSSLSQLVGVANEFAPHPIGNLMHFGGIALLMVLGFPLLICDLLAQSFALRPVGGLIDIAQLLPAALILIRDSFMLAMVLAAPFILGGFLFQALSGIISKVMPALPIVFIGAPAAILIALTALALLAGAILSVWSDHLMGFALPEFR